MPAKKVTTKKPAKKPTKKPVKKSAAKKAVKKPAKKPSKKVTARKPKKVQEAAKDVVVAPVVDTSGVVTMNPVPNDLLN